MNTIDKFSQSIIGGLKASDMSDDAAVKYAFYKEEGQKAKIKNFEVTHNNNLRNSSIASPNISTNMMQ